MSRENQPDADVQVVVIVKHKERFVFVFTDRTRDQVLQTLGRFAENPDLNFTWYDAAIVANKIRKAAGAIKST